VSKVQRKVISWKVLRYKEGRRRRRRGGGEERFPRSGDIRFEIR